MNTERRPAHRRPGLEGPAGDTPRIQRRKIDERRRVVRDVQHPPQPSGDPAADVVVGHHRRCHHRSRPRSSWLRTSRGRAAGVDPGHRTPDEPGRDPGRTKPHPGRCPCSKASATDPPGLHRTSAITSVAVELGRATTPASPRCPATRSRYHAGSRNVADHGRMVAGLALPRGGLAFLAIDLDADQPLAQRPPSPAADRSANPTLDGTRPSGSPRT